MVRRAPRQPLAALVLATALWNCSTSAERTEPDSELSAAEIEGPVDAGRPDATSIEDATDATVVDRNVDAAVEASPEMRGSFDEDSGTLEMDSSAMDPFSFFVVSLEAMQRLSGSPDGFGGDLRYGEDTGLAGADRICREVAESSMPGSATKQWRAFLSVVEGPEGTPIHAIERIGEGPWYDRLGRVVAEDLDALLHDRPLGADPAIVDDLPNEWGIPNGGPDGSARTDNHHILTGSGPDGRLYAADPAATCEDWTSSVPEAGRPRTGFSWPHPIAGHWISAHSAPGCDALVDLSLSGPGARGVGAGGGYGGIYCFARQP